MARRENDADLIGGVNLGADEELQALSIQAAGLDTEKADVWEADTGSTLKAAALKALFDIDPGKEHQSDHQATVAL